MWFLVEFLIFIGIFFILKKYWHMDKVQKYFIDFVISINIITCLMYMYLIYLEALSFSDGMSKIFDKFTQLDSSIIRKYEGTGLGLALCHDLVEFLGGLLKPGVHCIKAVYLLLLSRYT